MGLNKRSYLFFPEQQQELFSSLKRTYSAHTNIQIDMLTNKRFFRRPSAHFSTQTAIGLSCSGKVGLSANECAALAGRETRQSIRQACPGCPQISPVFMQLKRLHVAHEWLTLGRPELKSWSCDRLYSGASWYFSVRLVSQNKSNSLLTNHPVIHAYTA
jgi:hypothetical protein